MPTKRFLMNAGRTTKQGQQVNVGKDYPEYQAIVSTLTMHPGGHARRGRGPGRDGPGAHAPRGSHVPVQRGQGASRA